MSVLSKIEFDDVSEHEFDNTKLKIANDQGALKSQVSANEILFSNFDTDDELTSKRGAQELVLSGVANTGQIANGKLEFPNQDSSRAKYENIVEIVDDFAFRSRVEMNVVALVTAKDLMVLKSNVDDSEVRIFIDNQGGGFSRIRHNIIDSGGATISSSVLFSIELAITPNFEISFSNDDDGNMRSYVNGLLKATVASPNFDFTDCDLIVSDLVQAVANYDDIQLFKSNEFPILQLSPYAEPVTFDLNENIMVTNIPFILDELLEHTIIENTPANTESGCFLILDNIPYWHDGANWVVSNKTLAESNMAIEINNNAATLPIVKGIGVLFQMAHIFKSLDGYTTPVVESVTIKFSFKFKADDINRCIIYGTVTNNAGEPVPGATVEFDSDDKFADGIFVGPKAIVTADNKGDFAIGIIQTETAGTTVDIIIKYQGDDPTELEEFSFKNRVIPNLPSKKLSELLEPVI